MKPTSWHRYQRMIANGLEVVHPDLNIFAARYAIARGFPHFEFNGVTSNTSESYFVAMKLSFAYTAFESLEYALNEDGKLKIYNQSITTRLRSDANSKIFSSLRANANIKPNLQRKLQSFSEGENENLRYFAYSVRNLMFHGSLTANSLQLDKSKGRREVLELLSEATLDSADKRFTSYVDKFDL